MLNEIINRAWAIEMCRGKSKSSEQVIIVISIVIALLRKMILHESRIKSRILS